MENVYRRWLDDELSQENKDTICREEGWPPTRAELIFLNGIKDYGASHLRSKTPLSGQLVRIHPEMPWLIEGKLVSQLGESWADGFFDRVEGDKLEFIESYPAMHSKTYTTTYSLTRVGNLWVGTFEGTHPNYSAGKIELELVSRGLFKLDELGRPARPYIQGSPEPSPAVLAFLKKHQRLSGQE